jgi:phosphate-selective porin OprO/OprP
MTGELYKLFGFMVMPRWDRQQNAELHYAWLETLKPSWAQIRVGLFKEPFSLEALTTDAFLNFVERSLVVRNFCQIEDIGIMIYGKVLSNRLAYSIGIFNGRGRQLDNNNNKEIVGRLVYNLFTSRAFGKLYVGISESWGRLDEDLSGTTFVTEENTPFWKWTHNVEVHSSRVRWGVDLEWLKGPFYFSAEYLYTNWGNVHKGSRAKFFQGHGGYVECSYLLTGEDKPRDAPVIPKYNVDPCKDQWGAWEVAVKYEIFYASKKMIRAHFAKGANYLQGPILALNWYLNPRMVMRLDGQYLWFNRVVSLHSDSFHHETVVVWRIQAIF